MIKTICLDENYSTTKFITKARPDVHNEVDDKFESVLFLKEEKARKGEGGLRINGYFKNNYKNMPLVSIITVVYNGEKHLEETIQSILNQKYDNVEYIIIDGGSTDGTIDIIKKYENKIDYWISERDAGIYDAMNKGLTLCSGEIIGIVNADDYIYTDIVKKITSVFEDDTIKFTYGQVDLAYENGEIFDVAISRGTDDIRYKLFKHMPFLHPTMFVKKEVYKKIGLFNIEYKLSADYDFVLKLVKNQFNGIRLNFSTGIFRLGGQSGGLKSCFENHNLLVSHDVNILFIYLNTIILLSKLSFRYIMNKIFK